MIWEIFVQNAHAYLATLGIAAVCAYLGLFTVLRRIVFTGVALAQLAACGVAAAFFAAGVGVLPGGLVALLERYGATAGSLGASLAGALLLDPSGRQRISPDAKVGMVYAASGAIALLLVWRSPQGLAELRNILAGEVLLAQSGELVSMWVGLAAVVALHAVLRERFLLVSYDPEFASSLGLPTRRLQLLFLGSLAVAVALALKTGGLLLVFSYLVLPPVAGLLLGGTLASSTRAAVSSALGGSLIGFVLAIHQDLPVAPTIAAALLALTGLAWIARRRSWATRALRLMFTVSAVLAVGAVVPALLSASPAATPTQAESGGRPHPDEHEHEDEDSAEASAELERLHDPNPKTRRAAAKRLAELRDPAHLESLILAFGTEEDDDVCAACLEAIRGITDHPEAVGALERILHSSDPDLRVHGALTALRIGNAEGIEVLVAALADPEVPPFVRLEALDGLVLIAGGDFGLDPTLQPREDSGPLAAWRRWYREQGSKLRWNADVRAFR